MKRILFVALSCICISISTSCLKEKTEPPIIDNTPKLPEATHIGANTFGCYINGELFVAESNKWSSVIPTYCSYDNISPNELRVQGSRLNDTVRDNIQFGCYIFDTQKYNMDVITDNDIGYITYVNTTLNCMDYYHDLNNIGTVSITYLDTINRIIAGNFKMDVINKCNESLKLHITNGVFDLKY